MLVDCVVLEDEVEVVGVVVEGDGGDVGGVDGGVDGGDDGGVDGGIDGEVHLTGPGFLSR